MNFKEAKCPNCGAPVKPKAVQCAYCNATLSFSESNGALVSEGGKCPTCASLNALDAVFCSKCSERLQDSCKNCGKLIVITSEHCPFCGVLSHPSQGESVQLPDFQEAIALTGQGRFPEADAVFRIAEKKNGTSDEFYAAWIENYMQWGKSFDCDVTMHNFAHQYRQRAKDLLSAIGAKFPGSKPIEKAKRLIENNWDIKKEKKKDCFVASVVYGDPNCDEVCLLRSWRDNVLDKKAIGRIFIRCYYHYGPRVALFVGRYVHIKQFIRYVLSYLVRNLLKASSKISKE